MIRFKSLMSGILVLGIYSSAAGIEKEVSSQIEKVTVYFQGAHVQRHAKVSINAGETRLVFTGISPDLRPGSIQAEGKGNFTILSTTHRYNYLAGKEAADDAGQVQERGDSIKALIEYEKTLKKVLEMEEGMIMANKSIGGQEDGVIIGDLKEASVFFRDRLMDIRMKMLEGDRRIKKYQVELGRINKQLAQLNLDADKTTGEVVITVNAKAAVQAEFKLSYMVDNARWYPAYDLRVKDVSGPMELQLRANVSQNTGEDWDDVKLSLTSADPSKSSVMPSLQPYFLANRYARPTISNLGAAPQAAYPASSFTTVSGRVFDSRTNEAIPFASIITNGTSPAGTVSDENGTYILRNLPHDATMLACSYVGYQSISQPINSQVINFPLTAETLTLDAVVVSSKSLTSVEGVQMRGQRKVLQSIPISVTQSRQMAQVHYDITDPYTIVSDGKNYMVNVTGSSLDAVYEYSCVPKLDPDVFLIARIDDWEDKNLLKAEINLYYEGKFVGVSLLDPEGAGDTLLISLGRDQQVSVKRTLVKEYCTKQFLGSNKKDNVAYRIEIRNNKTQKISLLIEDQFPVSNNKEIEVSRNEWSGGVVDPESGKISWSATLAPGETKKLDFGYTVKYPAAMPLNVY